MTTAASKRHAASPQKLERARKEGQVAKSPVFTQLCQLVGMLCGLLLSIQLFWSSSEMVLHYSEHPESRALGEWMDFWRVAGTGSLAVSLGLGLIGVLFGEVLQVGIRVALKPIRLDFSRLHPVQGVQKVGKQLKESWFLLVKFLGAGSLVFLAVYAHIGEVPHQWFLPVKVIGEHAWDLFLLFGMHLIGFFAAVGMVERLYKRALFLKEQRMSDEEVKREWKESEGDPHMKSHRRSLQQQLASGEILSRMKKTRVIIVKKREPIIHES